MLISVGELQKNISLLNNLREPIIVMDKRSHKKIAKIEPIKDNDLDLLDELLNDDLKSNKTYSKNDFNNIYMEYLSEKYNFN